MKFRIQITLIIAAVLYISWGLALVLAPEVTHRIISEEGYDRAATSLFGASLLAWVIAFLIAARSPSTGLVQACGMALAIIGLAAIYCMVSGVMPVLRVNLVSLIVDLGAAAILLTCQSRLGVSPGKENTVPESDREVEATTSQHNS